MTKEEQEKQEKKLSDALDVVRKSTEKIEELKKANEGGISEMQVKVDKANVELDNLEKKNTELVTKINAETKSREEMADTIKGMETKMAQMELAPAGAMDEQKLLLGKEIKAMKSFAQQDYKDVENKYLRYDSNVEGGFLMRDAYDDMILKKIVEQSPMRQVSRSKKVDAFALDGALRESEASAFWTGEGEDFEESNSTYSAAKIPTHSATTLSIGTNKALLGSVWDLETEITSDQVEARLTLEGAAFNSGNGVSKPMGFLDAASGVAQVDSGSAATFDFDNLITLTGELKTGYNAQYSMNRKTLAFIRTLKDTAGAYIWRAGNLGASIPNQINGDGYIIDPNMPNIAADALPVAYADWMKFYTIVDSFQAIFLRNPYKTRGKVEFSIEGWVGGAVALKEAGVLLKCST